MVNNRLISTGNDRQIDADRFEKFVKSSLINAFKDKATIDPTLPNDKRPDVKISLADVAVYLECTILTDSDKIRQIWNGRHDEEDSLESIVLTCDKPVRNAYRFFAKIHDKLAPKLNPQKSQLSDREPNILLISFFTTLEGLIPTDPFIQTAIKELLSKDWRTDSSLFQWLNFTSANLVKKGKLATQFEVHKDSIIEGRRKISAIFLFRDCDLQCEYINENAIYKLNRQTVELLKAPLMQPSHEGL